MIRSFAKGVLIGMACICLLALGWLFLFRPSLAQYEASKLKAAFVQNGPGDNSGVLLPPWSNAENEKQLDLVALQAQYPDVQAWLSIPGTCVDYPVLQSSAADPEYYLRRNFKGEYRTAGSLFLQADCSMDGKTLIVYGHDMNDGSMFGCLPRYLDSGYCSRHSQIQLQTSDGIRQYAVAAALETDISRIPFNRSTFTDDADFLAFAQSLLDAAAMKTGVPISADSQLLILVTCSYSWPEARYVIVAVREWEKGA